MRIVFVFILLTGLSGCKGIQQEAPIVKACRWLWAQQAADGGWHSDTHGILKGGEAYTPFVLHTLLSVPDSVFPKPAAGVVAALAFIRRSIDSAGHVGIASAEVQEYPNYATAYALRVLAQNGTSADRVLIRRMANYLMRQQFTEQRAIYPDNPVYGAWGYGERLAPGVFGHVDLSHTRRVLQALHAYGKTDSMVFVKSRVFLRLLQKRPDENRPQPPDGALPRTTPYDGGFYSSPVIWGANKAGVSDSLPRFFSSYATATADGLLSLLATGLPREDPRVRDALNWVRLHSDWSYPEGIPRDNPAQWDLVLKFYHMAVRAEVFAALDLPAPGRQSALDLLAALQTPEGCFTNPYGAPNKEDDPVLATALAVLALKPGRQ